MLCVQTDPVILSQAMEWCEYRSPDGKPYYFNVKSNSSVWEKPQILKDYEGRLKRVSNEIKRPT